MLDGRSIYAHQAVFADHHIVVRNIGFDPSTGSVRLGIDENHENVGLYRITVTFGSGIPAAIDYDGGNPHRDNRPIVRTEKQYDTLKRIEVARVLPRASVGHPSQGPGPGTSASLVFCQVYERLQREWKSAREEWAYFAYPQNKILRCISDHKSKQLARKAQEKMREMRQRVDWHHHACDVCKGLRA
jgi:hypothetical protein